MIVWNDTRSAQSRTVEKRLGWWENVLDTGAFCLFFGAPIVLVIFFGEMLGRAVGWDTLAYAALCLGALAWISREASR